MSKSEGGGGSEQKQVENEGISVCRVCVCGCVRACVYMCE